jgi:predicted anti-sigma-YlaC factor YlaD
MHLTDDHIQDYLDGNLATVDPVVLHLKECPDCQKAVEYYQALYQGLEADPGFALSSDFADNVVANLPPLESPDEAEDFGGIRIRDWVIWVTSIVAVLGAGLYFINPLSILNSLVGWIGRPGATEVDVFQGLSGVTNTIGINSTLIIFAVFTFIIIAVIDRVIAHQKSRRQEFSIFA